MSSETAAPAAADADRSDLTARVRALAGQGAVAPLITMLAEPSWFVRREVVAALASLGDEAAHALLRCLRDERGNEARIAATVDALVASKAESVEGLLIALAREGGPSAVLADVAQILGRRGSRAAYGVLSQLTEHPDDNVAVGAIEALGSLGGRASVEALIACVKTRLFFRTFPAIDVLGRSGDPRAVEPLSELLSDSRYALEAARALGRCADRRAVKPLAALLLSPSDGNVRVACLALVELCERHAKLYGSATTVLEALRLAGSDAIVRRLGQSVARADSAERVAVARLLGALGLESAALVLMPMLNGEPEVTEAAGKALLKLGRSSEGALSDALRQGDSRRRKALLPISLQLANAPAILECLDDPDKDVRVLACASLARIGAVSGVPRLFTLLDDDHQRVVHAAVAAIQSLGTDQTEAMALRAAEVPRTRRAALRILAYFGFPSALPLFVGAASESDPRLRDVALQGMALIDGPEARERLLLASVDEDAGTRAAATRALGQLSDDPSVTARLLVCLHDSDPWVRYYACQALGRRKAQGIEDVLRTLVGDAAGQVRVVAIEALSNIGSARAIETLRECAEHEDKDMRRAALVGLGLSADPLSIPTLQAAAAEGDSATRLVALSALTGLGDEHVIPVLAAAARDPLEPVRVAAINLLAERPGEVAASTLVQLLLAARERTSLMHALTTAFPDRLSALHAALEHADGDQAALLVACVARSRAGGAESVLYQSLASSNPAARRASLSALAALGTKKALNAIAQNASTDPDPEVRRTSQLLLAP